MKIFHLFELFLKMNVPHHVHHHDSHHFPHQVLSPTISEPRLERGRVWADADILNYIYRYTYFLR